MIFKPRFSAYLLALLIFVSSSTNLFAQASKVDSDINSIIKELEVVGLSVAVVKGDDVVYSKAFGKKDIENNIPLSVSDMFRIASISKSFSATSIMQLVEAKKISLSDDISDLVGFKVRNPKYPETVITLKMVLSHRSSINDSQGYFSLDYINPAKNPDWAKCYNDYAPDQGYQYCNLNFNMVGAIIERVSGERFDQYVKHHVLDPLGLYGGYCVDSLDNRRFATLYEYNSKDKSFTPATTAYSQRSEEIKNYTMGYSTPVFSPTGGMKITPTDLAKYMTMHMQQGKYKGKRIISKKSAKTMQTAYSKEEGYGLAIMNLDDLIPGEKMTGHTGSAYGLYSAMFFQPKKKFGIVVITNGCNPSYTNGINTVLRKTLNALYNNLINLPSN